MTFTATGPTGEVRIGGRVAATLGKWTLTPAGTNHNGLKIYTIIGPVTDANDFLLFEGTGRKELRVPAGQKEWRWRDVMVGYDGEQVTVTVTGKPEIYD